jgi:hypothetical protein
MPRLSLEDALRLVHLYAEGGAPKFEAAARRWLVRYIEEGSPRLRETSPKSRRAWRGARNRILVGASLARDS